MKSKSPFLYCLGQSFVAIKRNKVFFFATVATIAACVFLVGLFTAVAMNLSSLVSQAEENVCITVFFDEGIGEDKILAIGSEIGTWEEVERTEYTSAEEAWESYKLEYFAQYPELADAFAEDNPLANSASFDIYLKNIENQPSVVARIEALPGVRQVNRSETTASALTDIGKIVGIVSAALIIILMAVSIFLITNTIVTGIALRKEEIQIMKYVGATDFFVNSPFIFEGLIIGIVGAAIPLVILLLLYRSVMGFFIDQFQTLSSTFTLLPASQVFALLVPLSIGIGAAIGLIGSLIATRKHIKV